MATQVNGIQLDTKPLEHMVAMMNDVASIVVRKIAFDVEANAKSLAPVDLGALKASIYVSTRGESSYRANSNEAFFLRPSADIAPEIAASSQLEAIVGVPMGYAAFVEFGTSRMGAQPFLTPAIEMERENANKAWAAVFKP